MSAVLSKPTTAGGAATAARADADSAKAEKPPVTVVSAVERLAVSRERLREAMLPTRRTGADVHGDGVGRLASGLVDKLRSVPAVSLLLDSVQIWWAQHPLRGASQVALEASRRFTAPLAERSPLALLFAAALFGAVLVVAKPWRWLLRPALFAGLVPAVAGRLLREFPIGTLFKTFASSAATSPGDTGEAEAATAPPRDRAAERDREYATRPTPTATEPLTAAAMQL